MLVTLRLAVPPDLTEATERLLRGDPRVCNLVIVRDGAVEPQGDAIFADVAREGAAEVLSSLADIGIGERGAISVSQLDAAPSRAARAAERAAPGSPDDGVIWHVVEEQAWEAARPSVSFHVFLCLAVALASIAVVTDSVVLVIGAMVVGPEFSLVAAICIGIVLRRWEIVRRSAFVLVWTFALSILVVGLLALVARGAGWVTTEMVAQDRPLTGFIWHPDRWSFVVALLAGMAGVLSMTTGKSSALVGVFISVTTVPAAGNLALALAVWVPQEIQGSGLQLLVNIAGMTIAGVVTLLIQRAAWGRISRRRAASPPAQTPSPSPSPSPGPGRPRSPREQP